METDHKKPVHVVGGGLVGALAAIQLARHGLDVVLHEQRSDMRKTTSKGGRSINLALSSRGLKALNEVGLVDEVMNIAVPMKGRELHDIKEKLTFSAYSKNPMEVAYSVSREGLNTLLLRAAEQIGRGNNPEGFGTVDIRFDHRCTGFSPGEKPGEPSTLIFGEGADAETVHADVVIGADGGGKSAVMHHALDQRTPGNYKCDVLDYKYKELSIPPGKDGDYQMKPHDALHIWPRDNSYMFIALPNQDKSFTGTLFLPDRGKVNFGNLNKGNIRQFFKDHFPDASKLMPEPKLEEDFADHPVGDMNTVTCKSWHLGGKLLLMGDAAHAVVPFHGQGMNAGFEDCTELGALIRRHKTDGIVDWNTVFAEFEKTRKPNTDALAQMSLDNLKDMCTADNPTSLLKKKIGWRLEEMSEQEPELKDRFVAHYTMVTFRPHIPYAEVRRRDQIQDGILEELASGVDPDGSEWRDRKDFLDKARALIRDRLEPLAAEVPGIAPVVNSVGTSGEERRIGHA